MRKQTNGTLPLQKQRACWFPLLINSCAFRAAAFHGISNKASVAAVVTPPSRSKSTSSMSPQARRSSSAARSGKDDSGDGRKRGSHSPAPEWQGWSW
ncbi:hypothetical protein GOP47_0002694 [Adiantum capillus-veneris]|uniref:Uncharacterized protein n=1 Tax=Adiantum capillus-veneris TaxID=13818 RepID=A0A9D4VAK1_ADICA|nr:hypothetical protein GOP47_0002694 [Adiantum capillus-veneris]